MNLRAIREELGLTQRQMAKAMGLAATSRHNLSNMETGRRPITAGMAARVALLRIAHKIDSPEINVTNVLEEIDRVVEEALRYETNRDTGEANGKDTRSKHS